MKSLDVTFSGLYTSANPFSQAPPGAFEVADNVVLRDPSLVEPCRGYTASADAPDDRGYPLTRVFPWNGRLMALSSVGLLWDYSAATGWRADAYGTYSAPDASAAIRAAPAGKSFFFTTASGTQVLDEFDGTVLPAGIPAPPYLAAAATQSIGAWLGPGASAAYRAVLCRYDANDNLIQSAPSPRVVVTNSSAAQTYGATKLSKPDASSTVTATAATAHGLAVGQLIDVALGGAETYFAAGTFSVVAVPTALTFTYSDAVVNASGSAQSNTQTETIGATPARVTVSGVLPYVADSRAFSFAQLYRTFSVPAGATPSEEYFLVSEHAILTTDLYPSAWGWSFAEDITPDTALNEPLYTNANTGGGEAAANLQPPLARDLCLFGGQLLHANTTEPHTADVRLIGTTGLSNGSTVLVSGVSFTASTLGETLPATFHLYTGGTPAQNIETTARSLCRCISTYFSSPLYSPAGTRVAAYYVSGETDAPGKIVLQEQGVGGAAFSMSAGQDGQTCWTPDLSLAGYTADSSNNRQAARVWWSPPGTPWAVPADNWETVGAEDKAVLRVAAVRSTAFIFKEDGVFTAQFGSDGVLTVTPFDPGLVLLAPETPAVVNNQIFCWTNRGAVFVTESGVSPQVSKPIARDLLYLQANYTQYPTSAFGVPYENEGWYLLAAPAALNDAGCSQQYVHHAANPGLVWTRWLIANATHGCFDPATQSLVWCVGNRLWLERKSFTSADFRNPDGSAIACTLRLLPISADDLLYEKHFRTLFLSFKNAEFTTCTVGFDSDANNTTSTATKTGPAPLAWGAFAWGTSPWTLSARNYIMRFDVPQGATLAATLGVQIDIAEASTFWQLQGLSLLYDPSTNLVRRG